MTEITYLFKTRNIGVSILFSIVSLIVLLFLIPEKEETFDKENNFLIPILTLVNVIVFFSSLRKCYPSRVRYDVFFIIGFFIVHFQIPFLASIGIEPSRPSFIWINKLVVNYATWFSSLFMIVWIIGFYSYVQLKELYFYPKDDYCDYQITFPTIKGLAVISFFLFLILVGNDFLSGNYKGIQNWGPGASHTFLLFNVCLFLWIIYFFINNKEQLFSVKQAFFILKENKLLVSLSSIYILIFIFVGDRGFLMQLGLLILAAYSISQHNISLKSLLIIIISGALFFTIIGFGRSSDVLNRQNNILTEGYNKIQQNDNPINPTDELATSVRILYRALDVVPEKHPYLYGETLFNNIIAIIPFSSSIYSPEPMYSNSTLFFTYWGQGKMYTYGEGSEIIADLYINIGLPLTLLISFSFGYFISYISDGSLNNRSHLKTIIFLLLTITSLYINRSNILSPIKLVVYAIVIDYLFSKRIYLKK